MIREQRKKQRKVKLFLKIFITLIVVLGLLALIILTCFQTKTVDIEGNQIYDSATIQSAILEDEYCQNSLYLYLKYNYFDKNPMPFIDTLEVSFITPSHVKVTVYEKALIGYIYDEKTATYNYFDKDGIIVEQSESCLNDVTQVEGLNYDSLQLYQVMQLDDDDILSYLLTLTQNLSKYELNPDKIVISGKGKINMMFGNVTIEMGKNTLTEEKVMRLQKILPSLNGRTGTINLQEWSEDNSDIVFTEGTSVSGDA